MEKINFFASIKKHYKKAKPEDTYFICKKAKIFGVADGVGGYKRHGIDPGDYPKKIKDNCKIAINEKKVTGLLKIVESAYKKTKVDGGTTLCLAKIKQNILETYNLGDSGLILIRNKKIIFRTKTLLSEYNYPFQLGRIRNKPKNNRPKDGAVQKTKIKSNDILIMATDGLFDNLFDEEIMGLIKRRSNNPAKKLVNGVFRLSHDRNGISLFVKNSRGRYEKGGKKDDIICIVALIKNE